MQDKKITYLVFSTDYNVVQIGLFRGSDLQETVTEHKFTASKHLMSACMALLARHHLTWGDLSFLATNQGPGPFTTMRVIIATLNGLSFATGIPLIGVDGLHALFATPTNPKPTLALLNAFTQEAYYAYQHNGTLLTGWAPINALLEQYKNHTHDNKPYLIGNGVVTFAAQIAEQFPYAVLIDQPTPLLEVLAQYALESWHKKETAKLLLPLYLKTMNYQHST